MAPTSFRSEETGGIEDEFKEVLENALLLSRDVFGNYIEQRTLEHLDQKNRDAIGLAVKGRMRRLSFDVLPNMCRAND